MQRGIEISYSLGKSRINIYVCMHCVFNVMSCLHSCSSSIIRVCATKKLASNASSNFLVFHRHYVHRDRFTRVMQMDAPSISAAVLLSVLRHTDIMTIIKAATASSDPGSAGIVTIKPVFSITDNIKMLCSIITLVTSAVVTTHRYLLDEYKSAMASYYTKLHDVQCPNELRTAIISSSLLAYPPIE